MAQHTKTGAFMGHSARKWKVLLVHPSALMYSEVYLRLEPLGMERVAGAARDAGHQVRAVDLQVLGHAELDRELSSFTPDAVGAGE